MWKTLASIFITLALIFGAATLENRQVQQSFLLFKDALLSLYDKTEAGEVTYEDGTAVEKLWEEKKKTLHIWVPHTSIYEVDYQLYEAVGYLFVRDYKSALPKIEILVGLCENIPQSYRFRIENIL